MGYTMEHLVMLGSKVIPLVSSPDEELLRFVADEQSSAGRGGMDSKLRAILNATRSGESVILANGTSPDVLDRIQQGQEDRYVCFWRLVTPCQPGRKWIGYTTRPEGMLLLDEGATEGCAKQWKVSAWQWVFQGDSGYLQSGRIHRTCANADGVAFGRGLVNYSSSDIRKIIGLQVSCRLPHSSATCRMAK